MKVYRFTDLYTRNLEEIHNQNNQEIFEKVTNFMTHNNLTTEDFFVGGSSCSSYMNYLILEKVRDIDIFMLKDIEVEKTEGIDIINSIVIEGRTFEFVEKDGLKFLSPWCVTCAVALKAIFKRKKQSMLYFKVLLNYMGMTVEDFLAQFEQELDNHVFALRGEGAIDFVKANLNLLQERGRVTVLPDFLSAAPMTLSEGEESKRISIIAQGAIPEEYLI